MYDLIQTTEKDHFEEYRMKKLSASGLVDDDPAAFAKKVFLFPSLTFSF